MQKRSAQRDASPPTRLKSITVRQYRSCQRTKFDPGTGLSVLIGPNGSGKTNVLSAIRLLQALLGRRYRRFRGAVGDAVPCELKTKIQVGPHVVTHHATIRLVTDESNEDEIVDADEHWTIPTVLGTTRRLRIPLAMLADFSVGLRRDLGRGQIQLAGVVPYQFEPSLRLKPKQLDVLMHAARFCSGIAYYGASQFANPGSCPISFEVESEAANRTGISIRGHKRFLFDLYQQWRQKERGYSEYFSIVGPRGIGLIDSIEFSEIETSSASYSVTAGAKVVARERKNMLVVPRFGVGGSTLSPSQLSEGTFKTLALLFYLVSEESSLMLLEEPEVCVHRGLLSSIVELIKTYATQRQIVVSTHSESVLDQVDVDSVFVVKRTPAEGTQVTNVRKRMSRSEIASLRSYLETEGSLGEFWRHGDLES